MIILVATLHRTFGKADSFPVPSEATVAGSSMPQPILALDESQVEYGTDPSGSYCNKLSAFWDVGTADCPSGIRRGADTWLRLGTRNSTASRSAPTLRPRTWRSSPTTRLAGRARTW